MKLTVNYIKRVIKEELDMLISETADLEKVKLSATNSEYPSIKTPAEAGEAFDVDAFITKIKNDNPGITPEEIAKLLSAQGKNKSPVISKMNADQRNKQTKPGTPRDTVKNTLTAVERIK